MQRGSRSSSKSPVASKLVFLVLKASSRIFGRSPCGRCDPEMQFESYIKDPSLWGRSG